MMDYGVFAQWVTVFCLGFQIYHYLLYPAILGLLARLFGNAVPSPVADEALPNTSLIICAHNEAGVIAEKIANALALSPSAREIIVVNDGSDDKTLEIARRAAADHSSVQVVDIPDRDGKSAAMNVGASIAKGTILVFSDASELYERAALSHLLAGFSDPRVAVISGAHHPVAPVLDDGKAIRPDGIYWRYEDFIRRSESALGSTVACLGAMLAIRKEDWEALPVGTVNDDAYIAMRALARGRDVRFAPTAISWEETSVTEYAEQVRRRRISAGRILLLARSEIWPVRRPWVLCAFLSHKVMRLALPLPMIVGIIANFWVVLAASPPIFFSLTLAAQVAIVVLALCGHVAELTGRRWRLPKLVYHVVLSNFSVFMAVRDILVGRGFVRWDKPS